MTLSREFDHCNTHSLISAIETRTPIANDEGNHSATPGAKGWTIETGPRRVVGPSLGVERISNVEWSHTLLPSNTSRDFIGVVCVRAVKI